MRVIVCALLTAFFTTLTNLQASNTSRSKINWHFKEYIKKKDNLSLICNTVNDINNDCRKYQCVHRPDINLYSIGFSLGRTHQRKINLQENKTIKVIYKYILLPNQYISKSSVTDSFLFRFVLTETNQSYLWLLYAISFDRSDMARWLKAELVKRWGRSNINRYVLY